MVCYKCGNMISDEALYCSKCGTQLSKEIMATDSSAETGTCGLNNHRNPLVPYIFIGVICIIVGTIIGFCLFFSTSDPQKSSTESESSDHKEIDTNLDDNKDGGKADNTEDDKNKDSIIESGIKKGDYVSIGRYEQDNDTANGREPIEWEVLAVDGDKALVVSKYVLDVVPYNEKLVFVTWETCTLRKWMNVDFYEDVFSDEEKSIIITSHLTNENNIFRKTNGGNDTDDKIFCLSLKEIFDYYYYEIIDNNRIAVSQDLVVDGTEYAKKNNNGRLKSFVVDLPHWSAVAAPDEGVETNVEYETEDLDKEAMEFLKSIGFSLDMIGKRGVWWWLRTPGLMRSTTDEYVESSYACAVGEDSGLYGVASEALSMNSDADCIGVRPAMWINIK